MAGAPKGNQNATKEKRLISDALKRAVVQSPDKLAQACEKILDEAVAGNLAAFSLIADRLEGKPGQSVVVGGDQENPVVTEIRRIIVNAEHKDS